jgi:hypothetical protein
MSWPVEQLSWYQLAKRCVIWTRLSNDDFAMLHWQLNSPFKRHLQKLRFVIHLYSSWTLVELGTKTRVRDSNWSSQTTGLGQRSSVACAIQQCGPVCECLHLNLFWSQTSHTQHSLMDVRSQVSREGGYICLFRLRTGHTHTRFIIL